MRSTSPLQFYGRLSFLKMEINTEIWKEIFYIDSNGEKFNCQNYEVSNLGRVRNKYTCKIKKQFNTKDGYKFVQLQSICSNKINLLVHRLVGFAFLENNENKPQINHKNKVRFDNKISNLEWVTAFENILHAKNSRIKSKTIQ